MITMLIATFRKQIEDRRRYHRAIAEIEALSLRDLADMRADPIEMARHAHAQVYGKPA